MTDSKQEDVIVLERVPCIDYSVQFQKRSKEVTKALINSDSEVNTITPAYAK